MVRQGSSIVSAATAVGVTEAALRSACKAANVYVIHTHRGHERRLGFLAQRNRAIVAAFLRNDPLEAICRANGVTPTLVQRLLARELNVTLEIPPRICVRGPRAMTPTQARARAVAIEYLKLRSEGSTISLAQMARNHHVNRDTLNNAVRVLRNENNSVDDSLHMGVEATKDEGD